MNARDHELDDPLDGPSGRELEAPEQPAPPTDLKEKTAKSIFWTILRTGSDYILSFTVFAVLARKLGPEAFGLFALGVAFAEFGKILPAAGLTSALPRARQVTPAMADTVFWTSLGISVLVAGTLAILSGPIAGLFDEPEVAPILAALGVILIISVAGATHIGLMTREFGHRALATRSVVSNVVGGAAALTAAWAGWGAWSLVVQRGITEIAGTGMAWLAYRWLPGRQLSFQVLRDLAGFSTGMTVTQILIVALVRVQDVIIGRTLGTAAVGVYRTAWRTVDLIAQGVIMPFTQVSLPTLGRLQDDMPAFRRAYLRMIGVSSALAFPAIIGFAVLAPDAVPLIFGPRWEESARIAQVLGFMAVPFTINRFAGPALATLGKSALLAKIAALQLVLTIVLTIAAAPYGLAAIAASYVARAYLVLPIQMWAFRTYSGLPYGDLFRSVGPALGTSLVMAGGLMGLDRVIGPLAGNELLRVGIMVIAGALIYVVALALLAPSFIAQQIKDVRRLLPGGPARFSGAGA
jgi:O-antigen/teichoic acid export membrane protein